jgi:DNA-binding GntR family transcriptional regulator
MKVATALPRGRSSREHDMARPKIVDDLTSSIGPIERETLNDRVYRELKNSIMAGVFKPGSELTLRSVAEALGTSFMPVRDAMRRLVTERGLEVRPSRTIAIPILTAQEFIELRRVRVLLEGEAVALAAENITERQLADVRMILKKLEGLSKDRRGQFWSLNLKLHFAIYEAGASPLMLSIIESLWLQLGPILARVPVSRAFNDSADPHQLLVRALAEHDPKAARAALIADLTQATGQVMKELRHQETVRA